MVNEIIIDGCNVAECEFYTNLKMDCSLMPLQNLACSKNPNCYFKQLKRLEKELEQYKNKTPFIDCKTCSQVKDLKAENEKLKDKAYKDADMIYQLTEENREYDIDLSIEKEAHKSTIERLDKYHKALEDIKNLLYTAENTTNGDLYFELVSKTYMKCNEVLNES